MKKKYLYIQNCVFIFKEYLKIGKVKSLLILLTFVYVLVSIINVVVAYLYGGIINLVLTNFNVKQLYELLLIYAITSVLLLICGFCAKNITAKIGKKLELNFRMKSINCVIGAKYSWIQANKSGDSIGRILNNTSDLAGQISYFIPDLFRKLLVCSIGIIVLISISPLVGVVFLFLVFTMIWFQLWAGQKAELYMTDMEDKQASRNALYYELLNSSKTISIFGMEKYVDTWLNDKINSFIKAFSSAMAKLTFHFSAPLILNMFITIVPLVIASVMGINQLLSVSEFIVIITLIEISTKELNGLNALFANLPRIIANQKIVQFIWDAPQQKNGSITDLNYALYPIDISEMNYSYDNCEIELIKLLSLRVNSGEKIAIVGKNGSGKSTLLKLINGFYETNNGIIKLYGTDINEIDKAILTKVVGYLTQDVFLFNDSIKNNITLNKAVDEQLLIELLQMVNLDEFIKQQNKGIDTIINENMSNISGGEKQRIALVRQLIQQVKILIIDEFTSSIDIDSEKKIMEYICNLPSDITIISTIHKLEYARLFSRVIVMDNGEIMEDDTYENLIKNNKSLLYKMIASGEQYE